MSSASSPSSWQVVSRIGAGVLGGYVFVWGFIALGLSGLYALGMPFHDAEALSNILGFLLYLTLFLWAFSTPYLDRAWLVLVGSGALMAAIAALIQHMLV
ncbi:MAG TPA: iron uptake protein [Cellvibrio sp.]|nr:iron uptake protein [Cellvibrio sp.]